MNQRVEGTSPLNENRIPYLIVATEPDRETIQNMARFYVYDMSRHCGELEGWEMTPYNWLRRRE
jgi:hypothetical protein